MFIETIAAGNPAESLFFGNLLSVLTRAKISATKHIRKTVNSHKNDIGLLEEYTVYTAHGIDFYIVEPQEGIYQAIAEYADMQYCIVCGSYGELIFIISNLTG